MLFLEMLCNIHKKIEEIDFQAITDIFYQQVISSPEAICIEDGESYTYLDLYRAACKIAYYLEQNCSEGVVGITGEMSFGFISAMLGTLMSGRIMLTIDSRWPEERKKSIYELAEVKLLLNVSAGGERVFDLPSLSIASHSGIFLKNTISIPNDHKFRDLSPDQAAYIFFTSGTTGTPKGILGSHKSLSHFIRWQSQTFSVSPQDRFAQTTGLSFDVLLRDVFVPICSGSVLVLYHHDEMLSWLKQHRISALHMVPSLAYSFLQGGSQEVPSLRITFFAGEPLLDLLVHRWLLLNPSMRIINFYGPTETTLAKCYYEIEKPVRVGVQPIGQPMPQAQALIVDPITSKLLGVGEIGEIAIRTPYTTLGYLSHKGPQIPFISLNLENLDSSVQYSLEVNNPSILVYKTGDLGRYNNALQLEIVGRCDHQVKINGVRIELSEVTYQMMKHPSILQATASTWEDITGNVQLVGFYVEKEKHAITEEEMRGELSKHLPYAMVPKYFCKLEKMPLLNNGKIDFTFLKNHFNKNYLSLIAKEGSFVPETKIESELVQLFQKLLGIQRITAEGNFFKLGGHSLLATQLLLAIKQKFSVELSFEILFMQPTIKQIAKLIVQSSKKDPNTDDFSLEKNPIGNAFVLSSAQKRLYFLDQLIPDKSVYNVALGLEFTGPIDSDVLEKSVDFLTERHASLRTEFRLFGGEVRPVILQACSNIRRISFEGSSKESIQQFLQNEVQNPFELNQGAPIRFYLLKIPDNKHLFFMVAHHIISDGWSMELFINELGIAYNSLLVGQHPHLSPIAFDYVDFAFSQEKWNNGFRKQIDYWKFKLANVPPLISWNIDNTRPLQQSYKGTICREKLSIELSAHILTFAKDNDVTLFMFMLTAYAALLHYYSSQNDIVIGSPVANRHYNGIENTVGFFVNLLPIRLRTSEKDSFKDLLDKVKSEVLESFAYQDLPFDQMINQLQGHSSLQHHPLCQATFVMQHEPLPKDKFSGLSTEKIPTISVGSKFDLSLFVYKLEDQLTIEFEYSTDLFSKSTIDKMLLYYQKILTSAMADPDCALCQMQLMNSEEYHRVVTDWNKTEREIGRFGDGEYNIVNLFEEQVVCDLDRCAIVDNDEEISYRQLNEKANQLASFLHKKMANSGNIIAICLPRSIDLIIAIFAVLKARRAFLVIESNLPEERRNFILNDSSSSCLITNSNFKEFFKGFSKGIFYLDELETEIEQQEKANLQLPIESHDLAYMVYTSGSTGLPKGALLEHLGVVNLARWQAAFFNGKNISQFASYSFDGAIGETFMALLNRGCLIIMPKDFEWNALVEKVNNYHIDVLVLTPSLIIQIDPSKFVHNQDLMVVSVGEACPADLAAHWSQFCHFINAYGPTEYTVYSHAYRVPKGYHADGVIPIGMPMDNTKCYVLNGNFTPVPPGMVGEVYLSGMGIARGYLNRKELTTERFLYNPFELQKHYVERGVLKFTSAMQEIVQFEEEKQSQFISNVEEVVSTAKLKQVFQDLDSDLIKIGFEILDKDNRAQLRYIRESCCNNYASSGINEEVLRKILPFKDFNGLRGVDFGIGNGEILSILKKMGADPLGLDMNPIFVQKARNMGITAYAIEVDCDGEKFEQLEVLAKIRASCDFVLSTLVIDRLHHPLNFLRNFLSLLKPHGKFALQTLLPIVGIDDNGGSEPIVYTPNELKIVPGKDSDEDKRNLLGLLISLGCVEIDIYQIPYVVVSRDAVQNYTVWSFSGSLDLQRKEDPYLRMYRTGDLGKYREDGNLIYIGRIDDQIKLRGLRIELQEPEAVIRAHEGVANVALLVDQEGLEKEIVAYLELNRGPYIQEKFLEARKERIGSWKNISDHIYSQKSSSGFIGWTNSYTMKPIPESEMREWRDAIVSRIKSLRPRRVLEVGCGTGLILSEIAPLCETYVAIDISIAAIERIKAMVSTNTDLSHVVLLQRSADNLSDIEGPFDTIIINSVIQYFPSQEYLLQVIQTLVENYLDQEGSLFIGDVKNLKLQKSLEASIAYSKMGKHHRASELKESIDRAIFREEELFIAPEFFKQLPTLLPVIKQSLVFIRAGSYVNELNLFRYDVVLKKQSNQQGHFILWHKWSKEHWDWQKVEEYLRTESPQILSLYQVKDPRLEQEIRLLEWLENKSQETLHDFPLVGSNDSCSASQWISIGNCNGYEVLLGYHYQALPGTYDIIFTKYNVDKLNFNCLAETITILSNEPLKADVHENVIIDIKKYLQTKLPEFMIPSKFAVLERIPLGLSGKVDRKAIVGSFNRVSENKYTPPKTPLEKQLHALWQSLLRMDQIGVHDDFFSLGGHSLLATRLASAISQELNKDIPLRSIFEYPTIVLLAKFIETKWKGNKKDSLYRIPKMAYRNEVTASYSQERFWFLNELIPDKTVYNMPMAFYLSGKLDQVVFDRALQEINHRHGMLKTCFRADLTGLKQVFCDRSDYKINWIDLSQEQPESQQKRLEEILLEQKNIVFDLSVAPLFNISGYLLNRLEEKRIIFITFHHILGDGRSLQIFSQELSSLYNAVKRGVSSYLPPLPISYADFSQWQRERMQGDLLNDRLNYWHATLYNAPKLVNWRMAKKRPLTPSYRGAVVTAYISSGEFDGIREFIQKKNVTLFVFLLSAFSLTLKQYICSQEFIIGIPFAGRHYQGVNDLIGLFVNTLPLRIDSPSHITFGDFLKKVKKLVLDVDEQQDLPLEKLIESLNLSGVIQHHPLFQIMFAMQNAGTFELTLDNIETEEFKTTSQGAKFDLLLSVEEQNREIKLEFEYSLDLFDKGIIREVVDFYLYVISSVIRSENVSIADIVQASPFDREEEAEKSAVKMLDGLYLPELLIEKKYITDPIASENKVVIEEREESVYRKKEAIASGGELIIPHESSKTLVEAFFRIAEIGETVGITIINKNKEVSFISYSRLLDKAKKVRSGLSQFSAHCAILQLDDPEDYFCAFWGCLLAGIVPITIALPKEYVFNDTVIQKLMNTWRVLGKPSVITGSNREVSLREFGKVSGEEITIIPIELLKQANPVMPIVFPEPNQTAFYQLTSGSTGISKCINITHESIIAHIHGSQQFNGDLICGTSLNWIPMDHVVPILTYHLRDVYLGWNQIQVATEVILENPLMWLEFLERYQVTHSWAPNFGYQLVVEALLVNPQRVFDLSSLKVLMNAGEQVTRTTVSSFLQLLKKYNVKENVMQPAFGMAEVCTCMTYKNDFYLKEGMQFIQTIDADGYLHRIESLAESKHCFVNLGPPIPGVSIRIVDKNNQLLAEEQIGRLQIKGRVVTPGYVNNPKANKEAFSGDGWFDSGDLGYISGGDLFLTGREKEMVIINGNNYYCYEIEALVNQIEGVVTTYSAAVSVRNSDTEIEELILFFSPVKEGPEIPFDVISAINIRITKEFGVLPSYVIPIAKKDFSKTTSGKIQRTHMKKAFLNGSFEEIKKAIDLEFRKKNNVLPDWFFRKVWKKVPKEATSRNSFENSRFVGSEGAILIFAVDIRELDSIRSDSIIIVERGTRFEKINKNHYRLYPGYQEEYELLMNSLLEDKVHLDTILHLWSNDKEEEPLFELKKGIYSLLHLYRSLTLLSTFSPEMPLKIICASCCSEVITSMDSLIPERSGLHGLINTLNIEAPWLRCQHIDLVPGMKHSIEMLLSHCLPLIGLEPRLAWREMEFLVPRLEKVIFKRNQMPSAPIKRGGCYLVTGGLGGIGSLVSTWLKNHYQCKLIIVGQADIEVPSVRKKKELLASLQLSDPYAKYIRSDISSDKSLNSQIEAILQEWSSDLNGIINLCGSFHEEALIDETEENFHYSLNSKLFVLKALYRIYQEFNANLFVGFSSVNGYFGGNKVGAYAAANACESALADFYRYQIKGSIYCFHFSMWDKVGISQHYENTLFANARGFQTIDPEQGINSLKLGLSHREYGLYVGLDPTNKHIREYFDRPYTARKEGADALGLKMSIPKTPIEKILQEIWQTLLQVSNVPRDANFFSLGGHSILAMRLIAQIRQLFQIDILISSLFVNPTLSALGEYIDALLAGKNSDTPLDIIIKRRKSS